MQTCVGSNSPYYHFLMWSAGAKRPNIWQLIRETHARTGYIHKPVDVLEAAFKAKVQIIGLQGRKHVDTGGLTSQHGQLHCWESVKTSCRECKRLVYNSILQHLESKTNTQTKANLLCFLWCCNKLTTSPLAPLCFQCFVIVEASINSRGWRVWNLGTWRKSNLTESHYVTWQSEPTCKRTLVCKSHGRWPKRSQPNQKQQQIKKRL